MGLANPDHVLTHDAGLLARAALEAEGSRLTWFCYEDGGYKHIPGLLAWRISKLFRSGLWPTPSVVPVEPDMAAKRTAIAKYTQPGGALGAGPPAVRAAGRQCARAVLAAGPASPGLGTPNLVG